MAVIFIYKMYMKPNFLKYTIASESARSLEPDWKCPAVHLATFFGMPTGSYTAK